MAPPSSAASPPPPPSTPPAAAKKGFLRRTIPFLLAANLAVGAYVFVRTSQKQPDEEEKTKVDAPVSKEASSPSETMPTLPAPALVKERPPIPEDQQRELFKWILEEKRKVKPRDKAEKKKIDEEKALLKEFIRAKSIPSI